MLKTPFFIFLLCSACTSQQQEATKEWGLKDINSKILIGSRIDATFNNDKYRHIIKTEFNTGQSTWFARWDGWLEQNTYNFSKFNNDINWMKEIGIIPTAHMLLGPDTFMPDWLIQKSWQKSKLDSLLRDIIYQIMDSNDNKNKVDTWNVVNELFEEDGSYRSNMVWNQLGWENDASTLVGHERINEKHPVFIRKAFTYCREKTNHKLELRDFNIENNNPETKPFKKHKAIYQLLKHLLNEHVPIDALGIQGHLIVGDSDWRLDQNDLKKAVARFKALGIEVYLTEVDASMETIKYADVLIQKQKSDYYDYIKQAIEGGVSRVYFWGVHDGMDKDWLPNEHPLLWDENLNKKPAYHGVSKALFDTK
jgi:GH35 family endo-1,4-beta-xylanase